MTIKERWRGRAYMSDYYKYHALGNDYIVIDPEKTSVVLSKETIKLICHRHLGIGSDGILYGPFFEKGMIRLKIFNPDGSEAEKSGSGIRIFSKYLVDARYMMNGRFSLETVGGQVEVEILDEKACMIKVDMGVVTFNSDRIPVKGVPREVINELIQVDGETVNVTCLSIGNPHCVVLGKDISSELACRLGPAIENHEIFPNRTNVQFLKVIDRNNIEIQIWERGAGYTSASGTSSCAAASTAYKMGMTDNEIMVHMPGGIINIYISKSGNVFMTGPVTSVANGDFTEEFKELLKTR
jgi:diaminopimelate epimerase